VIAPAVLAGLIASCAPSVDARTAAAIVAVESRGEPYAINDNTTRRSYFPASLAEARALVDRLAGHQIAVGIAQVDSVNFARFGVDARDMLEPCLSLRVGSQVLVEDYRREYARAPRAPATIRRQVALRRALSVYNSGSPTSAIDYAARVVAATASPLVREVTAISDEAAGRLPGPQRRVARLNRRRSATRAINRPALDSIVFFGASPASDGDAFVESSVR